MALWRVVKNVIVVATIRLNVQRSIRAVYPAIVPSLKEQNAGSPSCKLYCFVITASW